MRGLTTWSTLILEKLIVTQPDKKVLSFYKTSTEVKSGAIPPLLLHSFMAWTGTP